MKKALLTAILCSLYIAMYAQWSDTNNNFYDSLHMQVCISPRDQDHPLVVKSEPDGGYFVIWQDGGIATTPAGVGIDIFAQKYDKDGKRLWAENGIPVATSSTKKFYYRTGLLTSDNYVDYRNVSHACTDGEGGFYITYYELIAIGSYEHQQVRVQHILANGNRTLSDNGYLLAAADENHNYLKPQLIADGNKGFFIAYIQSPQGEFTTGGEIYAYCYRDEGGSLKSYGGGLMNVYAEQLTMQSPCGIKYYRNDVTTAPASGFYIYPDLDGGCNIIMTLSVNVQKMFTGYNRLCRVKKDSRAYMISSSLGTPSGPNLIQKHETIYTEGNVTRLYNYQDVSFTQSCIDTFGNRYDIPNQVVLNQGFLAVNGLKQILLNQDAFVSYHTTAYSKGVTIPTDGNINVNVITAMHRDIDGPNHLTSYSVQTYFMKCEKYDSIPSQLCSRIDTVLLSTSNMSLTYSSFAPFHNSLSDVRLDKLNSNIMPVNYRDTTIGIGNSPGLVIGNPMYATFGATILSGGGNVGFISNADYQLTASGNKIFIITKAQPVKNNIGDTAQIYFQQLNVVRKSVDSFAVEFGTSSQHGIGIARGSYTGFGGSSVSYFNPLIATDGNGNAMFYVANEYPSSQTRVSPIGNNGKLPWGAMGAPIGTAMYRDGSVYRLYRTVDPFAVMDNNGKAVIVWQDDLRPIAPGTYTGTNIYMRHIDDLNTVGYQPPIKPVKPFAYFGRNTMATPGVLMGTSNAWTMFETTISAPNYSVSGYTPLVSVLDNYPLGAVSILAYEYNLAMPVRMQDNKPYLSRNYTIQVANNPNGAAAVPVRLFFTSSEFTALKNADPGIQTPADLAVVKQPNALNIVPETFTPSDNDEALPVVAWDSVDGGYYIEIAVKSFSNFFIFPKSATALPVKFINFTATKADANNAKLTWQVAEEENVKNYTGQYSTDGRNFTDGCIVSSSGNNNAVNTYNCNIAVTKTSYYFRVKETDFDGKMMYSKVLKLSFEDLQQAISILPNPARDELSISGLTGQSQLILTDINGKKIIQKTLTANAETMNIGHLPAGVYMVHITDKEGHVTIKKIIKL